MTKLLWDQSGQRVYETGVDHGVLYIPTNGVFSNGVAWNGLTTVTESPSGAESTPQYADNIKYLNLVSAEEFAATLEALTYPNEFAQFDGSAVLNGGVVIGQQTRKPFGLSYRTRLGNDQLSTDYGYKLHLVYNAQASPSEKAYSTINDSPEANTFSWELSTTPAAVGTIGGTEYKPTAMVTVDSTRVPSANLAALEDALYGTAGTNPRLPLPAEVIGMFNGVLTDVVPGVPTATSAGVITIPTTTGVDYWVDGVVVTGTYSFTASAVGTRKVVVATPKTGFRFPADVVNAWGFTKTT